MGEVMYFMWSKFVVEMWSSNVFSTGGDGGGRVVGSRGARVASICWEGVRGGGGG